MYNYGDRVDLPFTEHDKDRPWVERGVWPAHWLVWGADKPEHSACVYRCCFDVSGPESLDVMVSGDHRYRLYLDGVMVGMGPELGDVNNYCYETYRLNLTAGKHCLTGLVFDFQDWAPHCQMSLRCGFLLAVATAGKSPEFLNSGLARWEVKSVAALEWQGFPTAIFPLLGFYAARWPQGILKGEGDGWKMAGSAESAGYAVIRNEFRPEHLMVAASLPPRLYEADHVKVSDVCLCTALTGRVESDPEKQEHADDWLEFFNGAHALHIPAHTALRIVGQFADYHCVYPTVKTRGGVGAEISLGWAEALYAHAEGDEEKGRRDRMEGKFFRRFYGMADHFFPAGDPMEFFTPWWRAGRFFELKIATGKEDLILERMTWYDSRYPLESEVKHSSDDEHLNAILPLCYRTLQMCTHDTFIDCPYYEQLMYMGDARLEALVMLASTRDDRMVRKMLRLFAASQLQSGFLYSRYPSQVRQIIPPFSLIWIAALHDFAMFRHDRELVLDLLGCAKKIAAAFERKINADGLVEFGQGWNFMDWTPHWHISHLDCGTPPGAEYGVSPAINWLYVYTLRHLAELCEYAGEAEVGAYYLRRGCEITSILVRFYYHSTLGMFVEKTDGSSYCEHSQCLALLAGFLPREIESRVAERLYEDDSRLDQTSISFSHYYFETCRKTGRMDAFFRRLQLWFDCNTLGLATLLERPEPSRSDCHGWSSHPYFHIAATLGGIRPAEFEFRRVHIQPQLGKLRELHTEMVHPAGKIVADYRKEGPILHCHIELPFGLNGELTVSGCVYPLRDGANQYDVSMD